LPSRRRNARRSRRTCRRSPSRASPGSTSTRGSASSCPSVRLAKSSSGLHAEFTRALALPDIREKITNLGAEPVGNRPEEFAMYIKSEGEKYARVIKASGAKAD
jgi:hypothetical protein